jgi:hypothetical protein
MTVPKQYKKCPRCGIVKHLDDFHKNKRTKDGVCSWCKECNKAHANAYAAKKREGRPQPIRFAGIKRCSRCGEWKSFDAFGSGKIKRDGEGSLHSWCRVCVAEDMRIRRANDTRPKKRYPPRTEGSKICPRCDSKKHVRDFSKNSSNKDGLDSWCKACSREASNTYASSHRDEAKARAHKWAKEHKDRVRLRAKESYHNNIDRKLGMLLRNRLGHLLRNRQKRGSAIRDLGCSLSKFKGYIEALFYPHPRTGEMMTWNNWARDGWHLDHIKPLSSFDLTDRESFLKACHYSNIQPLWAEENLSKGARISEEINDATRI